MLKNHGVFNKSIIQETIRLIKKNRKYIESRLLSAGFDKLILLNEELHCLKTGVFINIYVEIGCDKSITENLGNKNTAILCLYDEDNGKKLKEVKQKTRIIIVEEYYKFMNQQLKSVNEEVIKNYLKLFGYNNICFVGSNQFSRRMQDMLGSISNSIISEFEFDRSDDFTLYVTEYLDSISDAIPSHAETLGIRQFLYELEVVSKIPMEFVDKINLDQIIEFASNFINISLKENWTILFSRKTNLSKLIIKRVCDSNHNEIKQWYLSEWDNKSVDKIIIVQNGNEEETNLFYEKYKDCYRIERLRYIVVFRAWIMEEIVKHFKNILNNKEVAMYVTNTYWGINNLIYPRKKVTSLMIENRLQYEISNILSNLDKYEQFLKEIYEDHYSENYVKNIMDIPSKYVTKNGYVRHQDKKSKYLNVANGERLTVGQPENYDNTIYLLGGCTFFGYAVEDGHTIASCLQQELNSNVNQRTWKVVNMGTWGGNIDQTYKNLYNIRFKKGDIVVVNYSGYMPLGDSFQKYDISKALEKSCLLKEFYFNGIVHPNHKGYQLLAKELFNILKDDLEQEKKEEQYFYLDRIINEKGEGNETYHRQIEQYMKRINKLLPLGWEKEHLVGGIVMNCNPFTLGHQYLIEVASQKVDLLYIFVVEEDKSFFKFIDRIKLVKQGVAHLKNVVVLPSGNLIISTVTFPEYFIKDEPNKVQVDTSLDVEIFAQYIAPMLYIKKRFVGEEPFDLVTRQYNESMKRILPKYGIELIEIPRKKGNNNIVISASHVRRLLKNKQYDEIKLIVPNTTYQYLKKLK